MEILARFTHNQIDHTQDSNVHFVVSLKAPTLDWMQKRPKLCVVPVIDLSGSMQGDKLHYAKQSMLKLVDQLADGDFAGLIAFESRVHMIVDPQPVTADLKDKLKTSINQLRIRGGTNFADGMLKAVEAVQKLDLPASFLKRVIMFTDGQPTEGVTDTKTILKMLDSNRGSVTISSFGYGDVNGGTYNGCDQDFLLKFAELGKGNYAYVKNPDDALAAFGKELGGLLSTYATDLEVEVEPANGHFVQKVISNVEHTKDSTLGNIEIQIPDILCEETRHFVFEAKLAKQAKAFPRETTAFNVKLSFSVLTEEGKKEVRTVEERARVQFCKPADAQIQPNAEVLEIVNLHRVIRAQLEAEAEAKEGKFAEAALRMEGIAHEVKTNGGLSGNRLAEAAMNVRRRVGSSHAYENGQGYLRSFAAGGTRGYGTSSVDAEAGADLALCNVEMSNSSQALYTQSFSGRVTSGHEVGGVSLLPGTVGYVSPGPSPLVGMGPVLGGSLTTNFPGDFTINPVGEIPLGIPQPVVTPDLPAALDAAAPLWTAAASSTNKSGRGRRRK
jgi:Ca-activated chloride channel family protein